MKKLMIGLGLIVVIVAGGLLYLGQNAPKIIQAVIEDQDFIEHFGEIKGSSLKRPPRGYDADHKYIEDLKRKSFFAMKNSTDLDLVRTPEFLDEVVNTFEATSPLMAFICDARGFEF